MEGLSEWVVRSPGEVYQLMARGQALVRLFLYLQSWLFPLSHSLSLSPQFIYHSNVYTCVHFSAIMQRATGATKLNEMSSRSHAVCIIIVEKCTTNMSEEGNEHRVMNTVSAGSVTAICISYDQTHTDDTLNCAPHTIHTTAAIAMGRASQSRDGGLVPHNIKVC